MIKFKDPWERPEKPEYFVNQLCKEVDSSHYLYKFKDCIRTIAKSSTNDDVIYEIREMGFVWVHLTWANQNTNEYPLYRLLPKESDVQEIIDKDNYEFN